MGDVDGDGVTDWVLAAQDHLYLIDGATLATLADSGPLSGASPIVAANYDSLLADDLDADGRLELTVNLSHGLLMAELDPSRLFSDGFEEGDLSTWSDHIP